MEATLPRHVREARVHILENVKPVEALAGHHAFLLQEKLDPGVAYAVLANTYFDKPVLGFFQAPREEGFYRRTTGGGALPSGKGWALGLVFNYRWSLRNLFKETSKLALCIDALIYGVTKIARRATVEIMGHGNVSLEQLTSCLGVDVSIMEMEPELIPKAAIDKLSSIEWNREYRPWNVVGEPYGPDESHYVRFLGYVESGIVHWIDIDGVFHASPPGQAIALIDNIVQVVPNKRLAYDLGNAWANLVETAGIDVEHLIMAMEDFMSKAEDIEP